MQNPKFARISYLFMMAKCFPFLNASKVLFLFYFLVIIVVSIPVCKNVYQCHDMPEIL